MHTYVLFVISQTCYLSSTQLQLTWLVYIMDTLMWHGGRFFFLCGEEFFFHVVHILFFVVYTLLYIAQILFNIIYFVTIAHYITCTFACEFSINFLFVDACCYSLLGCSSAEEFMDTFADVLMNEVENMRSQFAHSMYIM